jgi:hypothetical protein
MPLVEKKPFHQLFVIASPHFNHRPVVRIWLKRALISLALLAIPAFAALTFTQTIAAPLLTVDSPEDYFETSLPSILVSGSADPRSEVLINGERLLLHENGAFSERVPLQEGANIIRITSRSQGETEIVRTVVRK